VQRRTLATAAIFGAIAVIAGAFGAHALRARLGAERLETWETAVRYLFYHLPPLLLLGSGVLGNSRATRWTVVLLIAGMAVFSGSLFLLVLSHQSWLGAVTPIGGLLLICAWVALIWSVRSRPA
jgi:uncharacterized membrane protein YgdD (TMEM256/DUF423 family)